MTRPAVLVFARHYESGAVKTRLAADIGPEAARKIYRGLAEEIWRGLDHPSLDRWLWVEPPSACQAASQWLPGAARVRGQAVGDLGQRMAAAFAAAFRAGAPWAAVVGTDAPDVQAACVLAAGRALAGAEVCMVPSLDGGYALLAMTQLHAGLFDAVPWSTECVAETTRARAAGLDLRLAELAPVRDVDTLADYEALRSRFASLAALCP